MINNNMEFIETSIYELYKNIEKAFPKTKKRQFSTDTIRVENLTWIPFLGVKTLFIKGLIRNESKKYDCIMLFKNIKFNENEQKKSIKIKMSNGKEYYVEQINSKEKDVLLRCNCKDFHWRFNFYNSKDHSLFGRKRSKYESAGGPKANPLELPGICKHLVKMSKIIKESNLLT
jgi:hypothetical protein